MQFDDEELAQIVAESSTIAERLESNYFSTAGPQETDLMADRLNRWRATVAKSDPPNFAKRLVWDGYSEVTAERLLGSVRMPDNVPLPGWARLLNEMLGAVPTWNDQNQTTDSANPIPFEGIFNPFAVFAVQKFAGCKGYERLDQNVIAVLQRQFLESLSKTCTVALKHTFAAFRGKLLPLTLLVPPPDALAHSRTIYNSFVQDMLQGKLLDLFREYPVLARLVATLTQNWIMATEEFLLHLDADYALLQASFCADSKPGQVMRLEGKLSDPHLKGRVVLKVTFSNGLKLIYKPRNLGVESAWGELLTWINDHRPPLDLKLFKTVNCSDHGWAEFVEYLSCADMEAVARFYRRAGMLLCLAHALNGTDFHMENVIASGEYPVLVDLETLLYPRICSVDGEDSVSSVMWDSVLGTGFLPEWQVSPDGKSFDCSGFSDDDKDEMTTPTWVHINTDAMTERDMPLPNKAVFHRPYLQQPPASSGAYVDEIIQGFREMYGFLLAHRATLIAPDGPLSSFCRCAARFVFRATRLYGELLSESMSRQCLRNGVERSIVLEALTRGFLIADDKPDLWPVLRVEQEAIARLDIPMFAISTDQNALIISGHQQLDSVFEESGYDHLLMHFKQLDQVDLEHQVVFIQAAFYAQAAVDPGSDPDNASRPATRQKQPYNTSTTEIPTQQDLLEHALDIAAELRASALKTSDGVSWLSFSATPSRRYQLQQMGFDLYAGRSGVMLFLAALEKMAHAGYHDFALEVIHPIQKTVRTARTGQQLAQYLGIGAASGLASVIYAFVLGAQFLEEPALLDDAQRMADFITPELIAADERLDIIGGAAGGIIGLLTLYQITGQASLLNTALACGRHLLKAAIVSSTGHRAWPTVNRKLLTGFSHGASGITYALARLYAATGDIEVYEAAREGIAYEHDLLSAEESNWPDLRFHTPEAPVFGASWCHGAPGIGLALLGILPIMELPPIRHDAEIAIETTRQIPQRGVDHLCCGTLGRLDALISAADRLARPDLLELARQETAELITTAQQNGGYALFPNLPRHVRNFGFFQGTAGIGYELLRLAWPSELPSILAWEGAVVA